MDIFVSDMNCSMPIDPLYAEKYNFKLVPVSELMAFEGITERIDYHPHKAQEQAAQLLNMGIENFKHRCAAVEPVTGLAMGEAVVDFSTESLLDALGGTLDPLLTTIKDVTGGRLDVEKDPAKAADGMLAHIEANRKKLGI